MYARCRALIGALICLCTCLLLNSAAHATTRTVPGQYANIQAAITASANGDVVQVAAGTYTGPGNFSIDFQGKAITVQSVSGPATTIINLQGTAAAPRYGFAFVHNETATSQLIGFTIENGNEDSANGGAIEIGVSAGPTIQNCVFLNNEAALGAITINGGSPVIRECTFTGNKAVADGSGFNPGGAIEMLVVSNTAYAPIITNCVFSGNTAPTDGAAIDISGDGGGLSPKITNCTFTTNNSPGGTIGVYSAKPFITNCILYGDTGGEIGVITSPPPAAAVVTVTFSDVQGGFAGTGNLNQNPLFAAGLDLAASSPAINAGTISVPSGADVTVDRTGRARDAQPDLGAYEVLAPTANGQSVSVAFNTATAITLTGSDPNVTPRSLTYTVTSSPAHGTLSGTAPNLTYTPNAGYHGTDSLTFTVNNGTYNSPAATVSLTVAVGTPTANSQSVSVPFNTATAVTLTGSDPDVPALTLTYTVTSSPTHGTLSGTAPNLTYTPSAGYHGADSFTFTVNNGTNTSTAATVSITVAAGTPTANGQSVSVPHNTAKSITLTGSDPDVPALSLTYTIAASPTHGTLSGTAPNVTYTPAAGYQGADSFTFTVSNGTNTSAAATVSVTVTPATPTANGQSVTTNQNTAKAITLTGTDGDDNPALPLTYTVTASPTHGTLSGTAPNLTYTPTTGYSGGDSFQFTVSNGVNTSSAAPVSITVNSVAATVSSVSVAWGTAGTAPLTTAADGLRLLPAGRSTDLPWLGINRLSITLSQPAALSAADVAVTGISVANYGPVTVSGSGTSYTITLAQPIGTADRVTITIGNAALTTYTRRLDVLPGDVSDDGVVNIGDAVLVRNMFLGIGGASPTIFGDINGDGVVDTTDYNLVRQRIGTTLP